MEPNILANSELKSCQRCDSDYSNCCGGKVVNDLCTDCKEPCTLFHHCQKCEIELTEEKCEELNGFCTECSILQAK